MKFSVFQVSRKGGRDKNEDRMGYCYTRESGLFVLADGMGGHPEGEVASQLALQTVSALFQKEAKPSVKDVPGFLSTSMMAAHHQIIRYAGDKGMLDTPRTTLVAAVVQDGCVTCIHCGDSRLYVVRDGELFLVQRDGASFTASGSVVQTSAGTVDATPASSLRLPFTAATVANEVGFDIIYATQDYEFDRSNRLHSLVVRWGPKNALGVAFISHIFMWGTLVVFGLLSRFRLAYWLGMMVIAVLLVMQHLLARRRSLQLVNVAFFKLNAVISVIFLVIVGVEVSTAGSDMAQLAPMVDQVGQRCGKTPEQWLVDGGFPAHEQIDAVVDKTEVYAPVPEARAKKDAQGNEIEQDKHAPKPEDSPAVAQWRQRMVTPEAKALYKLRAATAECVNAQARNRGLQRMPVRGLGKMRCVMLLFALAHNLMRTLALAPQLLGLGPTPSARTAGTV